MRLSRTAMLILGVGVFVIAFATLFSINSGQSGEQWRLNDSLTTAQALLPKLVAEREDWEDQLTQWENKVTEVTSVLSRFKAKFPKSVESIEYSETLFDIARECDLEVAEVTTSEPCDKKVEDVVYSVTTLEVVVRAADSKPGSVTAFESYIDNTVAHILDFIDIVATSDDFTNATIELVEMNNLEPPGEITGCEDKPEATISLAIYGYKGE
jgi:hypothetical protein